MTFNEDIPLVSMANLIPRPVQNVYAAIRSIIVRRLDSSGCRNNIAVCSLVEASYSDAGWRQPEGDRVYACGEGLRAVDGAVGVEARIGGQIVPAIAAADHCLVIQLIGDAGTGSNVRPGGLEEVPGVPSNARERQQPGSACASGTRKGIWSIQVVAGHTVVAFGRARLYLIADSEG